MKVLRSAAGLSFLIIALFSLEANFTSCKKEIVRDTVILKDTITVKDTIRIVDSSNCACYDLTDGLVAYYNFNNGTLNDSSGYGNHVILNNNAVKTADRYGRANNAYLFNGADSYMKVANSASLNPSKAITLMTTFKINGFYSANCVTNQLFGKGWNDFINGFYAMRFYSTVGCQNTVDTSKEVFYISYGDLNTRSSVIDNNNLQSNRWYNVIYTYADGVANLYVDGVLRKTVAQPLSFTANDQEMYIGKHGDPSYPYSFNGVIDEIRIYNKALCPAAVKQLYGTKQ